MTCPGSFDELPIGPDLARELRSDHAGELGAVEIYRGILAISRRDDVRRFAAQHMRAEIAHRDFFEEWLPERIKSRVPHLWRLAGWILGALAALLGAAAVYRTVEAVETFVEEHYRGQIAMMDGIPELSALSARLESFCQEETAHRRDAETSLPGGPGWLARIWTRLIGGGSAFGVAVARRL
jgi:ubiquinone biosynthesis monooxygenase Coq7